MGLDPVARNVDAPCDPDALVLHHMVEQALETRGTRRMAGKAHVQAAAVHQTSARAALKTDEGGGFDSNDLIGRIRSSTLVDLYTGYDWRKFSVELFATNVFDERNDLSRFVVCGLCTNVHIVPGRPRTLGVRVGTKF